MQQTKEQCVDTSVKDQLTRMEETSNLILNCLTQSNLDLDDMTDVEGTKKGKKQAKGARKAMISRGLSTQRTGDKTLASACPIC
jgi:hypothetical protein